MTELKEIREKIAKLTFSPPWSCLNQESYAVNHHLLADQILALIKEAGYKSSKEVKELEHQIEAKDALLSSQGDKLNALVCERSGEVWYWLGDGYDHPESLCCPILIEPEDILELINQFQPELAKANGYVKLPESLGFIDLSHLKKSLEHQSE